MDKKQNKSKTKKLPKKDTIQNTGELLYKSNNEERTDEIYNEPSVPGQYAGDC